MNWQHTLLVLFSLCALTALAILGHVPGEVVATVLAAVATGGAVAAKRADS